jgi:hypothetical protein
VRPVLSPLAVGTAAALALTGCSSGSTGGASHGATSSDSPSASGTTSTPSGSPSSSSSTASSATPSSTVQVPSGVTLTDQGSRLRYGASANVVFETTGNRGTVLRLTVAGVRHGRLSDFKDFILDDAYKKQASYYYARVSVRNVGQGEVGGVGVPLWGVSAQNVLLPPVNFTTTFPPCPTRQLPSTFGPGASMSTCLVLLAPDRGRLVSVSYRPSQAYNPIVWTGPIAKATSKPTATPKPTKRPTPHKTPHPGRIKKTPIR